jgi:hypothetical protein
MHAVDQSFTELTLMWLGTATSQQGPAVNISLATTVSLSVVMGE